MIRPFIRHDLVWAGIILLLAALLGLGLQWQLVRLSWNGGLAAKLDQVREERRREQFQGIPTLNLAQTYEIFQQGQALFIDARPDDEYAELHLPGALNLPPDRLEAEGAKALAGVALGRQVVVYCGQVSCDAALKVAEKLQSLGYTHVKVYLGGFRAWDEAGYPAETSK